MFPPETRILIVDDMEATRLAERKQLLKMGFEHIYEANNGIAALKILNNQAMARQPIGLILCDWTMPELNGLEMLKKMQNSEKLKHTPLVMVSATSEPAKILEAVKLGVTDYILKPFDFDLLKRKLEVIYEKVLQAEKDKG